MPDFLRVSDVALELRRSPARVYQLIREGELPSCRIGGAVLIPRKAWEEFLADQAKTAMAGMKEKQYAEAITF